MIDWLLPVRASAHASELDAITLLVHLLMAALFIGWGSFFVYTLIRFRRARQPRADHAGVRRRTSTWVEAAVVLAELLLLVGFSIPAWATRVREVPASAHAVVVRVVAEQFSWNVHYPGGDGAFGRTAPTLMAAENPLGLDRTSAHAADDVIAINLIVVPIGRPVVVHLSAKDVIHSFGVPAMRVKQDAIPGIPTNVWFTPTRPGDYDVACSQLCGLGHYRMRATVRVVDDAEFRRWIAAGGE